MFCELCSVDCEIAHEISPAVRMELSADIDRNAFAFTVYVDEVFVCNEEFDIQRITVIGVSILHSGIGYITRMIEFAVKQHYSRTMSVSVAEEFKVNVLPPVTLYVCIRYRYGRS